MKCLSLCLCLLFVGCGSSSVPAPPKNKTASSPIQAIGQHEIVNGAAGYRSLRVTDFVYDGHRYVIAHQYEGGMILLRKEVVPPTPTPSDQ